MNQIRQARRQDRQKLKLEKRQKKARGIYPLTRQFFWMIIGLVAGTVLLSWLLNTMFLGRFYEWDKEHRLMAAFKQIDKASQEDRLEEESFDVEFERLCSNGNLTVIIINSDATIVRSSVNDNVTMLSRFQDLLFNAQSQGQLLRTEDNYTIQKRRDERMDSKYLVMWGTLSDGRLIMARTPLESIREATFLTNRFLLLVGIVAIGIGALVSGLVSKKITDPILELSKLADRMSQLDFNAKYQVNKKRKTEIDLLGQYMNDLSGKLEKTISELKTANNELQQDNERKTQVDEMRKEFLSNVSHELKTPLALIQGYAEGLAEGINEDPESRNFYCEVIMDETEKMNRMVQKLLTLNHLEFGNDAVSMDRFDLTDLIQGVVQNASILIEQEKIQVDFENPGPVYVWADEFKVEEVIDNYLSNAIHYAGGRKQIRIFYRQKADCVRVSVFNTGSRIPEEDLDKVWIKFYKVDKARTREYGGSGIGLSIVKAIMDSFHRECGVENHEDGVEFWLELDTQAG